MNVRLVSLTVIRTQPVTTTLDIMSAAAELHTWATASNALTK